MQINIKGLQGEISPEVQAYAQEKVSKLTKFGNGLLSASVGLTRRASKDSAKSHLAEIVVHAPGQVIHVEESGKTYQAAIDAASERLKGQLKKLKTKREDRVRNHPGLADIVNSVAEDGTPKTKGRAGRGPAIVVEKFNIKPMTLQEAILQLKKAKRNFYLFYDAHNRMHCVYNRDDGSFGHMVPESEIVEH